MTDHEFQQTVFGKDATDVQTKAEEAVRAYFGDLEGVEWSVDSDAQLNLAGKVIHYKGTVNARRPLWSRTRTGPTSSPPEGCAWVDSTDRAPRCPSPPAYELTCAHTGMVTQACANHTALMRALHPDWLSEVATARYEPSTEEPSA